MPAVAIAEERTKTLEEILGKYKAVTNTGQKEETAKEEQYEQTEVYRLQLNAHGQVTIPKEVRKRYDLKPEDMIDVYVKGDKIRIVKVKGWDSFKDDLKEIVDSLPKEAREIMAADAKSGKTDRELMEEWLESPEGQAYLHEEDENE